MFVLPVQEEHVERLAGFVPVVDHPEPTPLAASGGTPPDLAQATGASDQWPLLGSEQESNLKGSVVIIVELLTDEFGEDMRLDEAHILLYAIGAEVAIPFLSA